MNIIKVLAQVRENEGDIMQDQFLSYNVKKS